MREYGFSLARILPYKDKIVDLVLIRENMGQWKPVFSHILYSNSDSQYFSFFAIFNNNVVKYEISLKFIVYAKYHKGAFIRIEDHKVL